MNQTTTRRQRSSAGAETINVLVVEGFEPVAKIVCRTLEGVGCDVWLAESGEVALELLPEHNWHVLVIDLSLPGISGLELLRRRDWALPAILMSAEGMDSCGPELSALNAVWLRKPFTHARLVELVPAADRHQARRSI